MLKKILTLLLLGLCGLIAGCVTPQEYNRQNQRLDELQREVRDLKKAIQVRGMETDRLLGQTRGTLPELNLRVEQLQAELQRVIDTIEMAEQRLHYNIGSYGSSRTDSILLPPVELVTGCGCADSCLHSDKREGGKNSRLNHRSVICASLCRARNPQHNAWARLRQFRAPNAKRAFPGGSSCLNVHFQHVRRHESYCH